MPRDGAGERALLVAEQLALQQLARQAGAVDVDERLVGAAAAAVEPAGEDPLPAAGLALDQHRALARHRQLRLGREGADRRRGAQEGVGLAALLLAPSRRLVSAAGSLGLEGALDERHQRRELDGFGEEVLSALLDRAHGEIDRAVAGEHDQRHVRIGALEPGEQIEGVPVGKHEVEHREVRPVVAEGGLAARQRRRLLHLVAVGFEEASDGRPHGGLVVDEEDLRLQRVVAPGASVGVVRARSTRRFR